jgi:hypothetical protein
VAGEHALELLLGMMQPQQRHRRVHLGARRLLENVVDVAEKLLEIAPLTEAHADRGLQHAHHDTRLDAVAETSGRRGP